MEFPMLIDQGDAAAGRRARRRFATAAVVVFALVAMPDADAAGDGAGATMASPPGAIEFTGRNLFGGAEGTFHRWHVVEAEVDPTDLEDARVVVEVDLASVDTGIGRRDDHLRTADFFEVERFPTARVEVDGLTPVTPETSAQGSTEDTASAFTATFRIDLHGVTRGVEGRVVLVTASPPTFEGELVLDRMDFAIGPPPSRWNPMSIDAEVPVRFRYSPSARP